MKINAFAGLGALVAALLVANGAGAATYVANYKGATLVVVQNSPTDFSFEVKNATANSKWSTATTLDAFAFNQLGSLTGDTLTATYKGAGGGTVTALSTSNLNNSGAGCTGNGGFFCFDFTSSPLNVTSDMIFDVAITSGSTPFSFATGPNGGPDLKIQFGDSGKKALTADYYSKPIPLCASNCPAIPGAPEPAAWAMMLAGFGAIGGTLRMRRKTSPAAV